MTVDKIAAAPPVALDAPHARAGAAPPPVAQPPAAPAMIDETPAPPRAYFDSLALPLPEIVQTSAPPAAPDAPYSREALEGHLGEFIGARLTPETITREVNAVLRRAAAARDMSIAQLVDDAPFVSAKELPSGNAPDARFTLQTPLLARDENGDIQSLDLYLTRAGARQWEVTVHRHDDAAGGFPYAAPPINVERLVIDPATGAILACVAMQIAPREFNALGATDDLRSLRAGLVVIAILAGAIILAHKISAPAAFLFLTLATTLTIHLATRK